ncbi:MULTISPECIES: hypothetical protein [Pseudomonas]|uniref:hypothetical protein n=1 Tax=Pseudomonas TaxID=286 RepID=UPI0006A5A424|nr:MULTISPECIES: hypothetical protein [Pseudomonas]MBM0280441.1 hypothetical protein [Pseudomonas chlororaphis]MDO1504919.1 hypothetical protein [Pseudomonas chlororaphis]ORM44914.1 hypothetical protein B6D51_28510 [Pseudomonas chlororaphis subsp. chlororaphis]TWR96042.1 hypothetical protein FJD36_13895 [Pseudomonas chlororaphis subsp. chlororaphis]WDH00705.1 hypothetical protein PUP54_14340 [Pseudomonas chlororaphis]
MQSVTPLDDRRFAFEARRLTIETLVKIYLEQVSVSRSLVTVYLRLMFTLSLGALAGVVTLYGAILRFSVSPALNTITMLEAISAVMALGVLVASALLSARALQQSAFDAAPFLHDPFPNAGPIIDSIFQLKELDEQQILDRLYFAIGKLVEHQPTLRVSTRLTTTLLVVGLLLTGVSFLI